MVYDYKQYNKYALIFRSSKINLVSTENSVTQKIKIVLKTVSSLPHKASQKTKQERVFYLMACGSEINHTYNKN